MGYNSKYTGAQIDALLDKINEGKTSTPRVAMTASTAELAPDTFYVWGMADSLDLTLADGDAGVMNKYLFQFRNPKDSVTMLTLPDDITWSEDTELDENGLPVMEATAFYRIEIIEGLASLKKWKLVYINFADAEVERVLMANGVGDGIGITKGDAAAVTSIGTWFKGNTVIVSFNEIEHFTRVTSLAASAFEGCTTMTSLPISRFTVLGAKALYNCTSLAFDELNLPNLTSLGQNAFYGVKIKKLNLGKVTTLPMGTSSTQNYGDKSVLEEVIIPEGVTSIPQYSFNGYAVLSKINFDWSKELSTIGYYAFASCPVVVDELTIHSVESISTRAFYGWSIGKLVVKNRLTILGSAWAAASFYSMASLTLVDLPDTLTSIGERCFQRCSNLATFISRATTPPTLNNGVFESTPIASGTGYIYVPDASVEAYKAATNWSQYSARIKPLSEYVEE